MSLSKRTQDILEIAICDKKASAELVSLLDSEGAKASFSGSVMASAAVAAQFDGQVAGMTTDVTIDADVAGAAGNVTLTHDFVAAVAAQFDGQVAGMTTDVTIDADVAGAAGNVTLTADSVSDIDALIAAHNLANPANTLTLSAGDGSQVPTADITLANGADASGSDIDALIAAWNIANPTNTLTLSAGDGSQVPQANITLASGADQVDFTLTVEADSVGVAGNVTITGDGIQDCATLLGAGFTISAGGASIPASGESVSLIGGVDAGGDMSSRTKNVVRAALCDKSASDEFISLVEAGSGSMSSRTKSVLSIALCDNKAFVEISGLFA